MSRMFIQENLMSWGVSFSIIRRSMRVAYEIVACSDLEISGKAT
jgi:hypothetical protein